MSDKKNRIGMDFQFGGSDDVRVNSNNQNYVPEVKSEGPFNMMLWGDFSGRNRQQQDVSDIGKRRLIEIDRDNIETILANFKITLSLRLDDSPSEPINVSIKSFDDFHPDELYENVEVFARLRSLRRRLKNNDTFSEAAAEIQGWLVEDEPVKTEELNTRENIAEILSTGLLDSILDNTQNTGKDATSSGSALADQLIKEIVSPYTLASKDPKQDEMVASVDSAITAHMQTILHHPDFQALESAWRSLDFLISRVDDGPKLKIYLLDVSKQELQDELLTDEVAETKLFKRFCDRSVGDKQYGLIVGNYTFADKVTDALLLSQIGLIAQHAGTSFIAAAGETLIGCESFSTTPDVDDWDRTLKSGFNNAWSIIRESSAAKHLGLALPGFLLRLPYGQRSKPVESFPFEEMPETHCHACYLWGNAAFLKAEQIVRAYSKRGWAMVVKEAYETENMPLHFYDDDSEQVVKPCAEIQLTERGGERFQQQGLMALWSVKNRDVIHSSDFCSLSADGHNLF